MKSFYVKDIFEQDTFSAIKNEVYAFISKNENFNYTNSYGRYWGLIDFTEEINNEILKKSKEHTGIDNLEIAYIQCIKYQKKDGNVPLLQSHLDDFYATYTLDITIETTIDWPLRVEDKLFECSPNSAVFLKGDEDNHDRPPYPGNDDDYMIMIFANLVPADHPMMNDINKLKDLSPRSKKAFFDKIGQSLMQNENLAGAWNWGKGNSSKPEREVKPWDFLNPNTEYATKEEADRRFSICDYCPELISLTKQCKKCGCLMHLKTKLEKAKCPLGKW